MSYVELFHVAYLTTCSRVQPPLTLLIWRIAMAQRRPFYKDGFCCCIALGVEHLCMFLIHFISAFIFGIHVLLPLAPYTL